MYIHRGKNRRNKRGNESVHFFGARKDDSDNRLNDEALRCSAEKNHISYFSKRIEFLMRRYLDTESGKAEVTMLMQVVRESENRKYLSLRDPSDESEVTKEIDSIHNNRKMASLRAQLLDIFTSFCEHNSDNSKKNLNEMLMRREVAEEDLSVTGKQFRSLVCSIGLNTEANVDEHFIDATFINEDFDYDPFATQRFDLFYSYVLAELQLSEAQKKKRALDWKRRQLRAEGKWSWSTVTLTSLFGQDRPAESISPSVKAPDAEDLLFSDLLISKKLAELLLISEARVTLIRCAVTRFERGAREEFRTAHRPAFLCEHCDECFADAAGLTHHQLRGRELHKNLFHQIVDDALEYQFIDNMFKSEFGRRLQANRLIFCTELHNMDSRIKAAMNEPLRPYIQEILTAGRNMAHFLGSVLEGAAGRKHLQLLDGMAVQGFDPSSGVRAGARSKGLARQHLAPVYQASLGTYSAGADKLARIKAAGADSRITDVLRDLQRWREIVQEPLDTVLVSEGSLTATVCFEWSGFAKGQSFVVGEFTGWKPEPMVSNWSLQNRSGTMLGLKKALCIGRYRYRFIIDGAERVNQFASQAVDPRSGKLCNIVVVSSAPRKFHLPSSEQGPTQMTSQYEGISSSQVFSLSASAVVSIGSHRDTATQRSDGDCDGEEKERGDLTLRLRNLNLRNFVLCDDGVWALSRQISGRNDIFRKDLQGAGPEEREGRDNEVTESVDLTCNNISDEGVQVLACCCLGNNRLAALSTLKLNANAFGADGCRHLADALTKQRARQRDLQSAPVASSASFGGLRRLEISGNRIGDEGMEYLSEYLRHNDSLLELFADDCLAGDDGMLALQHGLLANKTLQLLSLKANRIGQVGATRLAQALESNASLHSLLLGGNAIMGPDGAKPLGNMLTFNDSLTCLDLTDCGVYKEGFVYGVHRIAFGISENRRLSTLLLANNALTDVHAVSLAEALQKNKHLMRLELGGNYITRKWTSDAMMLTYSDKDVTVKDMPNFAHSLDRNRSFFEKCPEHIIFRDKKREVHPNREGQWTTQREWQTINSAERAKTQRRNADLRAEHALLSAEKTHVKKKLKEFVANIRHFLQEPGSRDYLRAVARRLTDYLRNLASFDPLSAPRLFGIPTRSVTVRRPAVVLRAWADKEAKPQSEAAEATEQPAAAAVNYFTTLSLKAVNEASSAASIASATIASTVLASAGTASPTKSQRDPNPNLDNPRPSSTPSSPNRAALAQTITSFKSQRDPNLSSADSVHSNLTQTSSQKVVRARDSGERSGQGQGSEEHSLRLFLAAHLSLLAALFVQQGATATAAATLTSGGKHGQSSGSRRLEEDDDIAADGEVHSSSFHGFLDANMLQHVFQLLTLPVSSEKYLQLAVDAAADRRQGKISLFRLADFLLENGRALAAQCGKLKRLRLWADLTLHPPIEEARTIILESLEHQAKLEILFAYRNEEGNDPKFVCAICQRRFVSEGLLQKHVSKGARSLDHRKFVAVSLVQEAYRTFLKHVKREISGMHFPAYYELVPNTSKSFNKNEVYSQQVLDKVGDQGRPIAAVEEGRTVRAIDLFGDYLLVFVSRRRSIHHRDEVGWVRFQSSGGGGDAKKKKALLRPVGNGLFDWTQMQIFQPPAFFRLSDRLPKDVRLKVYFQPIAGGGDGENICSNLKIHDVVEAYAQIGDWIQIRFEQEDSVWVKFQVDLVPLSTEEAAPAAAPSSSKKPAKDKDENAYGDDYLTYEVDGKRYKVLQQPGEKITPERVAVFDQIRFQGPPAPLDAAETTQGAKRLLLHRLPGGLQRLLLQGGPRQSPQQMTQRQLFQLVVQNSEVGYHQDLAEAADPRGEDDGLEMLERLDEDDSAAGLEVAEDSEVFHFPST